VKAEERSLPEFESIEGHGSFRLEVQAGAPRGRVVVEGDDNLVAVFETRVSEGRLKLGFPSGSYQYASPLAVRVEMPSLEKLKLSGAIDSDLRGLAGDGLTVELSGSCDTTALGRVRKASIEVSGASRLSTVELETEDLDLSLSGSVQADVAASRSLRVEASGASTERYVGSPQVEASTNGASKVVPR
jgi:hypothetical protein